MAQPPPDDIFEGTVLAEISGVRRRRRKSKVPRRLGAYRAGPPLGYRNEMVVALAEWQVDSDRWVDFAAGACVEPQLTTCM